jgi:hypothetical protein
LDAIGDYSLLWRVTSDFAKAYEMQGKSVWDGEARYMRAADALSATFVRNILI